MENALPPPLPPRPSGRTPFPGETPGSRPKNYLIENVVALAAGLFCCCGFSTIPGLFGIVFASQVNRHYAQGNYAEAARTARTARILFLVTLGMAVAGLLFSLLYMAFFGMGAFREVIEQQTSGLTV